MKLKLKFSDGRPNCQLFLDDTKIKNYGQLREEVAAVLNVSVAFDLSLNYGKDLLRADESATLQELGLVSGDVLTVVIPRDISDVPEQVLESQADRNTMEMKKKNSPVQKNVNGYMYKITLCRESEPGSIPSSLESLFMSQPVESKFDALVLVIHRLMSEVGFLLVKVDNSIPLLSHWKKTSGVYKMDYCYPACPLNCCQVVCVVVGRNLMVVHAVVCDGFSKDTVMNITLHRDEYVQNYVPINKCDPKHLFRDLPRLSQCFKDNIALPLLNIICMDAGIPSKSDFMSLPIELKQIILNYLNGCSLARLSKVCTDLNQLCNDDLLWRKCCTREFPKSALATNNPPGSDWKTRYIEMYKKDREQKKRIKTLPVNVVFHRRAYVPDRRYDFDLINVDRNHQNERRRILEGIVPFGVGFPRFI